MNFFLIVNLQFSLNKQKIEIYSFFAVLKHK